MAETSFSFVINGISIAHLVAIDGGYKWASSDLHDESSGRTLDGYMHVYRIGSKVQLDISCIPMSKTDAKEVLLALKSHGSEEASFPVTYEDPMYDEPRTASFYCSSQNCEFLMHCRGQKWWKNLKFTLIEC